MNRQSMLFAAVVTGSASAICATSRAQEPLPAPPQQAPVRGVPIDESNTYTYRFDDDSLNAVGLGTVPKITFLPRAARETLIRPRASFVVPLMRSVETVGDPFPPPILARRPTR